MDFLGLILGYGMGALGFWMIVTRMIRVQEAERAFEGSAAASEGGDTRHPGAPDPAMQMRFRPASFAR